MKLAGAADRQLARVNEFLSPSPRKEYSLEDYKGIFDGPPYNEVVTIVRARLKDLNLEHEGIALCKHASSLKYASIQFGAWKLYENITDQDYKDASAILGDFPRRSGDKKTDEGIEFMLLESARSHHKQVRDSIDSLLELLEESENKTPKRSSPEKAVSNVDRSTWSEEQEIYSKWQDARNADTHKADFAKDNGFTLREFNQLLDRVRQRRNRPSDK
jgi:hypothetical protein